MKRENVRLDLTIGNQPIVLYLIILIYLNILVVSLSILSLRGLGNKWYGLNIRWFILETIQARFKRKLEKAWILFTLFRYSL